MNWGDRPLRALEHAFQLIEPPPPNVSIVLQFTLTDQEQHMCSMVNAIIVGGECHNFYNFVLTRQTAELDGQTIVV